MYDWQVIRRRCLVDKEPLSLVARETGLSRNTLRKYLTNASPPSRLGSPTRAPELQRFEAEVDTLIKDTPNITTARIYRILRQRHSDFYVKERAARRYVARRREALVNKEVFIRQVYLPGDQTQYDFKDVVAIIAGQRTELHLFNARLSYSTAWFARCYLTEDQSALFDGIQRSAEDFCGVTKDGVFDNAKTAVDKVFQGRKRQINAQFAAFIGAFPTTMQYAAPRKGNEKGGVEGLHGYIEDNFFRPIPSYPSTDALNDALHAFSHSDRLQRTHNGSSVADLFAEEQTILRSLPLPRPRPCLFDFVKINKFSEVYYKTNRYSVPSKHVGKIATVEIFAETIRIIVANACVATHSRLFGKRGASLDPLHYLDALERKHRAVERSEIVRSERIPLPMRQLFDRMIEHDRDTAGRNFVKLLRFLETHRQGDVVKAIDQALVLNVLDPNAIALLLSQQDATIIAPLDIKTLPTEAQIAKPIACLGKYSLSSLLETP